MEECCELRGFLTLLVLKLISKKEMSGEEIREEIKKRKGTRPSPGTIYPVLKFLSKNGFIEETRQSGKMKKYRLTKRGKKELVTETKKFCLLFYDIRDDFDRCCR